MPHNFCLSAYLVQFVLFCTSLELQFSSVAQSCPNLCDPMDCSIPSFAVHHQLSELAQTHVHRVSDPTISSSVISFPSCLQSFQASGSFAMSQFFPSISQSIGASASASVLAMNSQDRFTLGLTGWIYLQSKGLSRVFSNTTVQKHYCGQDSLQRNGVALIVNRSLKCST